MVSLKWPYAPQKGAQTRFWNSFHPDAPWDHIGFGGPRGGGKGAPYETPIVTPFGYKKMGDLKIGSIISNPDGSPQTVLQIHELGTVPVFEIEFCDGVKTRVTKDHLWLIESKLKGDASILSKNLYTTEMIIAFFNNPKKTGELELHIPVCSEISFSKNKKCPVLSHNLEDKLSLHKWSPVYVRKNIVKTLFINKAIVDNSGIIHYDAKNDSNAKNLGFILNSLGAKVVYEKKANGILLKIESVNPNSFFYQEDFDKKLNNISRRIVGIKYIGDKKSRCITVSNPNRLYMQDDFIVTHNSYNMRAKAHELLCFMPLHICIVRKTRKDTETNHIEPMKTECREFIKAGLMSYNGKSYTFYYANGSALTFMYCSKDADLEHWQGQQFDLICFEEAGQFTPSQIAYMRTTCRTSSIATAYNSTYRPRCVYTFNWGGPSHRYLKRIFWDGYMLGRKEVYDKAKGEDWRKYIFIFSSVFDNPIFLKKSPEYLKALLGLKGNLYRAHAIGDPDAFQGSMFNTFQKVHIVKPFEIPNDWNVFSALDPGTKAACSYGIYATPPVALGRSIYKVGHYYKENTKIEDNVNNIVSFTLNCKWIKKRPRFCVAGHDAFARQSRYSINAHDYKWVDLFPEWLPLVKANTDRIAGAQALDQVLDFKYDYDLDALISKPTLQFFEGQEDTLERFNALEQSETNPEDVKQEVGLEDHDYDETRYAVLSAIRPHLYEKEIKQKEDPIADYGSARDEAFFNENSKLNQEEDWKSFMN